MWGAARSKSVATRHWNGKLTFFRFALRFGLRFDENEPKSFPSFEMSAAFGKKRLKLFENMCVGSVSASLEFQKGLIGKWQEIRKMLLMLFWLS